MSREKQNAEIYKPMCEELFNNIEKQYQELAKVKAESEQIEEMAKLACTCFDGNCKGCPLDFYPPCPPKASATRLYNAGYRKQSATRLYNAGYRKQSEWISVDERLPEEDTFVLVWCGEFSVFNYLSNGLWYTGYCDITTGEGGITHWMPLPEAPEGGAE